MVKLKPSASLWKRLKEVDTPTVCNAIEVAQGQRGFNNFTRKDFAELTLGNLQNAITKGLIDKNKAITEVELNAAGIVNKSTAGITLLNKGAC